jgi:hypothetical protein
LLTGCSWYGMMMPPLLAALPLLLALPALLLPLLR